MNSSSIPRFTLLLTLLALSTLVQAYTPRAEQVTGNVYAFIGPLTQRGVENDGLNNNLGFVLTPQGVILIDSGASRMGAERVAQAIAAVTDKPVRWVVNTGGQDHRWLGNGYFAEQGAETIALARTIETQKERGEEQLARLQPFLGKRLAGTRPAPANRALSGDQVSIELGGETLMLSYTDTHYPGDSQVWLPRQKVVFTGDLVYVDRLLGVLPWSSPLNGQKAFRALEALPAEFIVPGHGSVCDLAKARRETGDYYDFLVDTVGAAAQEMEAMEDIMEEHGEHPAFKHLQNFDGLHRGNINRTFVQFEAM